jgi:amidase
MNDFLLWSATRIAQAIKTKELSAREVVAASLAHIEHVNPNLNAVVALCAERATEEALAADEMTARGQSHGVLHGVPMTLKDSLDTQDIVSTGGTRGREHFVPQRDAPVVARLRKAGAILLGKTNTPELTLSGETDNLIYGRTNNPFNLDKTPGGSSGGSATAIASGMSAIEIGSDTGGSIREPAHYCGITGIKPTAGRTPRTGHIVPYGLGALDSLTQLGPMARYVEDLNLTLPIICGPDWQDPAMVDMPVQSSGQVDVKQLRIATYTDNGITPLDPAIAATIEETVAALRSDGLSITQALPDAYAEASTALSNLREADGGSIVRRLLARWGTTEPGPQMKYCFRGPPAVSGETYCARLEEVDHAKSKMLSFLRDYDAIICPASRQVAPAHGATMDDTFMMWSYCTVYNMTGWPAAVVRVGESSDGLPIGVQIVAAPWREDVALALAHRVETLMGGYLAPKLHQTST